MNKSELRTKTKVPAVRKAAIVAPPTGKATQGDTEANIQEGAAKVAVVVEDSKKNVLAEKPSAKLHEKTEAAWPNTEGDAKLVKKPVLKRGRSSAKSLGLDKIAVKALSEAKPDSEELKGNPAKQPANKVHKSHKKKVLASAPVAPRPILRDRAHEDKESEKGQDGERNVQKDAGSTEVVLGVSAGRLRSRIKNQITRIRREEALLEAYSGRWVKILHWTFGVLFRTSLFL